MLFQIFYVFFRIGLYSFGGGYAMLPMIEYEIVASKKWITEEEFLDLFSIAQTIPGIFAVNISLLIGFKILRFKGALFSALGVIVPSFIIILIISFYFTQIRNNKTVLAIFKGLRPAVIALITIPIYTTWKKLNLPYYMFLLPIFIAVVIWLWGISPIVIIFLSAIGGIIYAYFFQRFFRENKSKRK